MQKQVSILHHDYPGRVRDEVEERLDRLLKYYERIVSSRALLERHNAEHRVEIVCNVGHGAVLVADARKDAFSAALDEAFDRMHSLLVRHREKHIDQRRRAPRGG
ncbi:MAG: ribosome-associated translation inhibitor RaiA [Planctomycetes bacterium]|nr:ribosome-associated translation inhibitor RaiA [Planctomycetota bacterium]